MIRLGRMAMAPILDQRNRRRGWPVALAAVLVVSATRPGAVSAAETDQFLAWDVELADSSEQLNLFVNQEFERALARLNRRGRARSCEQVPGRLYRRAFSSLLSSRLRRFIEKSDIEWYPQRGISQWEYRARSVFRHSVFSFFLPMDRTVRIGDVYLGVDKLAHMFGIGRRYYVRHQRLRRRGLAPEEAQLKTIVWGLGRERIFLGGYMEGIVSHADLEANFQGLRLAREMCTGADPYLVRGDDGWRFARPIDLRDYVNPGFDESYNSNHYFRFQWWVVKPILIKEYCPRFTTEKVQRRMAKYRRIDPGSLSREVIARQYEQQGHKSQRLFTLENLCTGDGEGSVHAKPGASPGGAAAKKESGSSAGELPRQEPGQEPGQETE